MRASLDGLCRGRDPEPGSAWVLELKVPGWESHDYAVAGMVPPHYVPQCQWQLLVTGLDLLHYVSYYSPGPNAKIDRFADHDRLAVVAVTPDAELQAELLERAERFWGEVLEKRSAVVEVGIVQC